MKFLMTLIVALFLALPAVAQDDGDGGETEGQKDAIDSLFGGGKIGEEAPGPDLMPVVVPTDLLSEDGVEEMKRSFQAYYAYRTEGFEHRSAVFEWQAFSTKVIFFMVLILVFVGLYFSWVQFRAGMDASKEAGENPNSGAVTTFEAGTSGLKVSSPVLGVIILAISLSFFYLYLIYVYPVHDTF